MLWIITTYYCGSDYDKDILYFKTEASAYEQFALVCGEINHGKRRGTALSEEELRRQITTIDSDFYKGCNTKYCVDFVGNEYAQCESVTLSRCKYEDE